MRLFPRVFSIAAVVLLTCAAAAAYEWRELEEGLFVLRYDAGHQEVAEGSLRVLEEALVEFAPYLPPGEEPIGVLIAPDLKLFMQHTSHLGQISVSGLAKPAQGLIVMKAPDARRAQGDYAGTLRHELMHILLHRNTNRDYLPKWLNEGLSMSMANEYQWQAPLRVGKMILQNRLIDYHMLDHVFLAPGSDFEFGDAYAQALSMTRQLRDELGEETFWKVVHATEDKPFGEALREHAGMSPLSFWQRYQRGLWLYGLSAGVMGAGVFLPGAFLLIIAWCRRRRRDKATLRRWEEQERLEDEEQKLYTWDELVEDPEAWKNTRN